jgi:hypothetical protein
MNPIHIPGVSFHFIWKRDFAPVVRHGILSRYLLHKLGQRQEEHIYKAQRQVGIDLISIWDPWVFLKRHWRNYPLGSENRPWVILDNSLERHFQDVEEIRVVRSLRDPNPDVWVGVHACQHPRLRKTLNRVRLKIALVVMCSGPAPDLTKAEILGWIDEELRATLCDGEEPQVCVLLRPLLGRYDFPGYKKFENFVRFRIPPSRILGMVANEADAEDLSSMVEEAKTWDCRIYLPDGSVLVAREGLGRK